VKARLSIIANSAQTNARISESFVGRFIRPELHRSVLQHDCEIWLLSVPVMPATHILPIAHPLFIAVMPRTVALEVY